MNNANDRNWTAEREQMVRTQLKGRDITNPAVIDAMSDVPRHRFVDEPYKDRAYRDGPLPIGHEQTISQPYIVAAMTQAIDPQSDDTVLEIGTGSGYQAAVLSRIVDRVHTIEIVPELGKAARVTLSKLGYDNISVRIGDGYKGWPEQAPFDKIIVTAAPPEVPDALVEQLAPGGRMVVPVGDRRQKLKILDKREDGDVVSDTLMSVRFVPMVTETK